MGAIFGLPNLTGVVYDGTRNLFYMSSSDGDLYTYNPASSTLAKSLHLGGRLTGLDISPAGAFVLVADAEGVAFGSGSSLPDHHVAIHRVDLATWTATDLKFDVRFMELGPADVAITSQHTALLTTQFAGSGDVPFREFDAEAATFNSKPVFDLPMVRQASYLIPSESHRYVLVLEGNSSGGPVDVFDANQDKIVATKYMDAFNTGRGDITDAGLVVDVMYQKVIVTDLNLNLVKDLSFLTQDGRIIGAHFSDGGGQLLLWDSTADKILVYDTRTWTQVSTLPVSTDVSSQGSGALTGNMYIGNHGASIILQTPKGFEAIDLPINKTGDAGPDLIYGGGGPDVLAGGGGGDTIYGGQGDDLITDVSGSNRLWADEGNDSISGGTGFDDINGNMGNDTAHGNDSDDWVVGGKDQDLLFGDNGFDIVYGNLGDDTISGGNGADWVRGGQGADSVSGGDGDDWIWGDRGDDTISGGNGADIFHSFSGAGIDRITDFSLAQGDRVQLDPGTKYTTSQVGADTVIDMNNGDQVILVGVQASTLSANTVFVG